MSAPVNNAARFFHETWLGMVQPTEGLVVSIPALLEADASERLSADEHRVFTQLLVQGDDGKPRLADLRGFLSECLAWGDADGGGQGGDFEDGQALPPELSLFVSEGHQTLRPTGALRVPAYLLDPESPAPSPAAEAGRAYRLLVLELPPAPDGEPLDFDKPETVTGEWEYPPAKKLERLLRECRVPIGVLLNRRALRLIYAPHGEASGHIDFRFADMADVGGRPIYDALQLLLGRDRLTNVAPDRQLHSLLSRSRKMQAEVTTELSGQVFDALSTLLRGFEAADARAGGEWLRPLMEREDGERDMLFDALLTVLLRLVFLLYAEDAGLLPTEHPLYQKHYSLYALFARLEAEHTHYPDAMNRRYSAWPGLLALFRVVYLGASHGDMVLPARDGHLFDPHRFPFLEGFDADAVSVPLSGGAAAARAAASVPTVDDETIYRVLGSLIFLGGSRLSYRALQVEQIGSVYEGLMGWQTLRVVSPSVRLKPSDAKHAPQWVSVEELFAIPSAQREKWLKDQVGLKGKRGKQLAKDLAAIEKEHDGQPLLDAALGRLEDERVKGSEAAEPGRVVVQPGEERKRTSSHYTPPELSGPIVERALTPLLSCFGDAPTSKQILSLKVCDPAMGSGAFLVEACRFLGERLLEAWTREGVTAGAFGEADDLTTYARRQIAERCLYGVDKNPAAVEIAKLSLWLVTLQRDKPFTFLDHALRCGDALVGCDLTQITEFHWRPKTKKQQPQLDLFDRELADSLHEALRARDRIAEQSRHDTPEANREMREAMRDADDALSRLRLIGDLLIGAFFAEKKNAAREKERKRRKALVEAWLLDDDAIGAPPELVELAEETRRELRPFHWMLEFPEVFYGGRVDPLTGKTEEEPAYLDAVIGNPPFAGKNLTLASYDDGPILDWFKTIHPGAHGNADLCAHFFRRADALLGEHGTIGLVATNTIAQGDTRATGLGHIVATGGTIFDARDSIPWGGEAGVTVSTVHLVRGEPRLHVAPHLDGIPAEMVNSRLRPKPERPDPVKLAENEGAAFVGTYVLGMGFTLTPPERDALIKADAGNTERIFPYLGGAEVNSSPTQDFDRYVINFGQMPLEEAERWPDLITIVRDKVKPERDRNKREVRRKYWWRFGEAAPALYAAIAALPRALVTARVSKHLMFHFQPTDRVFSDALYTFPLKGSAAFATLQSRVHERWTFLLSSSMGRDNQLRYAASDCFQTFPFPKPSPRAEIPALEAIGKELYDTRAAFMVDTDQGLTKTYNALKDPAVTEHSEHGARIVHLRQLHLAMDQAVLEAYAEETGDPTWTDVEIPPFTTPQTPAERDLHQRFEDHILDKLFELNAKRAGR